MKIEDLMMNEELKYISDKGKWALVSKTSGRVLRYFDGSGKPSDDWVKEQERQIQYFAHNS